MSSSSSSSATAAESLEQRRAAKRAHFEHTLAELEDHRDQYDALLGVLDDLPSKLRHDVMVPFGSNMAFFEGEIRHTNEVVMHLGDCWFAERTVANAMKTIRTHRDTVDENVGRQKEAIANFDKQNKALSEGLSGVAGS